MHLVFLNAVAKLLGHAPQVDNCMPATSALLVGETKLVARHQDASNVVIVDMVPASECRIHGANDLLK